MSAICLSGASTAAQAALLVLPSQQIASGLATLQHLPVKHCIDFKDLSLPCGWAPSVGWDGKMGRKGVMRATQQVCTHSLKLSGATDLFCLFNQCNKTQMPTVR